MARTVPTSRTTLPAKISSAPAIVRAAGRAAQNSWRDFFAELELENEHTHRSYTHAIRQFLAWCEWQGKELHSILPGDVAIYIKEELPDSASTKKVHRSALKRYFDLLVVRHICVINPAASVKTPKLKRTRGTTPMIEADEIKTLMASIDAERLAGLRDRAMIAVLGYTAVRAGALARLRRGDYHGRAGRMQLSIREKGGSHREIEVRHDLETCLDEYLRAARMITAEKECPLFRPLLRKEQKFRSWLKADKRRGTHEQGLMSSNDVCRMVKRRMRAAGLRDELSAHSFRVAVLTDLIEQRIPLEDVQTLAGHADARTTKLYDRTQRTVSRNLVERIRLRLTDAPSSETEGVVPTPKVMKAELSLRIERNSKFVRGMKPSRESIEMFVLSPYRMEKTKRGDYILHIPHETDEDLEETIYEILEECERQADLHNCFTEGTVFALDGSERHWG